MKVKKEYSILVAVMVALVLYLVLREQEKTHYRLPELSRLAGTEISKIEISRAEGSISLMKKDNRWYIDPRRIPADSRRIKEMLGAIEKLTLTALVSESKNYILYDLGDDTKITVKAYAGSNLARGFDIGKKAPTQRHTFIRLDGDDKVYQANGDLRKDFDTTVADLRNKRVLTFSTDEITSLTIAAADKEIIVTKEDIPAEESGDEAAKEPKKTRWTDGSGTTIENAAMEKLLGTLSALDCQEYLDETAKTDLGSPATKITLSGTRQYSLSLFAGDDEKRPASSSESEYVFVLPDHRIESIEKSTEELLGVPGKE